MLLKVVIGLNIVCAVNGANILFFFGLSTYSHRITVWPLAEKLADKGHKVTFLQPFKPKRPNPKITEFSPQAITGKFGDAFEKIDLLSMRLAGGSAAVLEFAKELPEKGVDICQELLKSSETQEWIKKSKFDLVVMDGLMNECALGLSHIFGAKTIIYGTTHPFAWWFDVFGLPAETSVAPEIHVPFQYPMSFYGKTVTTLLYIAIYLQKQYLYYPRLDEIFRKYLDPNTPSITELERKASLIFTNTHFSEELARSLPPLVVPIGGMHCEDSTQKLTNDLEKFINESTNGFVFISFGSAARINTAPKEFQQMFYKALEALGKKDKIRFVWKYGSKRPTEMPENVLTTDWVPQQAILAHPKIKGFFTHAGLLSLQEAVWHGVPLIAMPVFAEQDYNAMRVERTERGVMLDVSELTTEKLEDAIRKVITDPKYKKNMQQVSKLFKDRPSKPVDTAVWWTEYVLRNDDLECLKPLGMHQTWFERRLLDVWLVIFVVILIVATILLLIVKKIITFICCASTPPSKSTKKSPQSSKGKAKRN